MCLSSQGPFRIIVSHQAGHYRAYNDAQRSGYGMEVITGMLCCAIVRLSSSSSYGTMLLLLLLLLFVRRPVEQSWHLAAIRGEYLLSGV